MAAVVVAALVALTAIGVGAAVDVAPAGALPPARETKVTLGAGHGCAVTPTRQVACWGANTVGQLGTGTTSTVYDPSVVTGLADVRSISSRDRSTCAVTGAGAAWCWGANEFGQLGRGTTSAAEPTAAVVNGLGSGVESISVGTTHACAVTVAGAAVCWGRNSSGQLGDGTFSTQSAIPLPVSGLSSGVAAIAASGSHTCARLDSGEVRCWGAGTSGRLGNGGAAGSSVPVPATGLASGVVELSVGEAHTCVRLSTDEVRCWGLGGYGQLGNGLSSRNVPTAVTGVGAGSGATALVSGQHNSCVLRVSVAPQCWGMNAVGQIASATAGNATVTPFGLTVFPVWSFPADVIGAGDPTGIIEAAVGVGVICFARSDGSVRCSGDNTSNRLLDPPIHRTPRAVPSLTSGVASVAAGKGATCAVTTAGVPQCWGLDTFGRLGRGDTSSQAPPKWTPAPLVGLTGVATIDMATEHACAVTTGGAAHCWGRDDAGQLGLGTTPPAIDQGEPRPIPTLTAGVADIATGWKVTCVLSTAGGVRCWGANTNGRLGNGAGGSSSSPVVVDGLGSGAVAMDVGRDHACAVTTAGAVKCWGYGTNGRLGNGLTADQPSPVQVTGLTSGYVDVLVGESASCAWKATGDMRCWGINNEGPLATGNTSSSSTPVVPTGIPAGAVNVGKASERTFCLVDSGGVARCWGFGTSGQVGDGGTVNRLVPVVPVGQSSGVLALASGFDHTCAIRAGGSVWCWGNRLEGALGTAPPPTTTSRTLVTLPGVTVDTVVGQPPGAPTGVTATAGNAQVSVSWTAPANNGGSNITGYLVTPYIGAVAQTTRTFAGAATTQVVTGLANGTQYTFRVEATNLYGTGPQSAASNGVTPVGPPPPWQPFASWDDMVTQVFQRMEGRAPTSGELSSWRTKLQNSTSSPGDLVAFLRTTTRHTAIVDPVTRLYYAYFRRIPDAAGLEYWLVQRLGGRSLQSISAAFAASSEFKTLYGTLTNQQFVQRVYQNVLGRTGSSSEVAYWTDELASLRRTRGEVMVGFSESPEYRAAKAPEVTVAVLYILLLDRAPTTQESASAAAELRGGTPVGDYADALVPLIVPA